jgi:hypothetical protein
LIALPLAAACGGGEGEVAEQTAFGHEPKGTNRAEFIGSTTPAVVGSDPPNPDAENGKPNPQVLEFDDPCDGLQGSCATCLCRSAGNPGEACETLCSGPETGS